MKTAASGFYDAIYPKQYIAYRAPKTSSESGSFFLDGNLDKSFWTVSCIATVLTTHQSQLPLIDT